MNLKKTYVEKYGYERVVSDRNSPLAYAELDFLKLADGQSYTVDEKGKEFALIILYGKCSVKGENFAFDFYATNASENSYPVSITLKTENETIEITAQSVKINGKEQTFEKADKIYGKPCYGSGHQSLIIDFYNAIQNGYKFEIDGFEASKVVKLILTAYKKEKNSL